MTPDPELLRLRRVADAAVRLAQDLQAQIDATALRIEEKDALAVTQSAVIDKLTAILGLIYHMSAQRERG